METSRHRRLSRGIAAVAAAALLPLAGCASGAGDSGGEELVIATTNFSETRILASMYEQVLADRGFDTRIKELTTREVIVPALSSGEVQITPEYLSSLATYLNATANGPDAPAIASGDVDATFAAASELAEADSITLLPPSAAQNQNAFAVTEQFAAEHSLATLTDLGTYSQGNPITLGGPPECPQRPFCQPGLEEVYGVQVASFRALDAGGPLTISALNQGTIQVGLVFSSSGSVTANNLVLLDDDKDLQAAENILPAVYSPALTDEIADALNAVSQALTTQELAELNRKVEVDRMAPRDVAQQFLQQQGLL